MILRPAASCAVLSGNPFREVIEIRPRPDRGLLVFALLLGCGACLAVYQAELSPMWKAPLALAICWSTVDGLRRRLWPTGSHYVARAVLLTDGRWTVFAASAEPVSARLCGAWGASLGPVIALEWRCGDGRRRQAWLLQGDLPAPAWRRLRVRLRLP